MSKAYYTHIEISEELRIPKEELVKNLDENELINNYWAYRAKKGEKFKRYHKIETLENDCILVSSALKKLIFKEYKRCHNTRFEVNFKSIKKDIERIDIKIAMPSEIKDAISIKEYIEKPAALKLEIIKSYSNILKALNMPNSKISESALKCVELEIDPFKFANDFLTMNRLKKRSIATQCLRNKIKELGEEFGDINEGRRRMCMAIGKQTGFDLKYVDTDEENMISIVDTLNAWDIILELCKEEC